MFIAENPSLPLGLKGQEKEDITSGSVCFSLRKRHNRKMEFGAVTE